MRLGAALARSLPTPTPIYRLMFSDEFAWGAPAKPPYLDAYLRLLEEKAPETPWMVAGLGVDIRPLMQAAVERGGHVHVGLGNAPWGSEVSNRGWVEQAVSLVRQARREPAPAAGGEGCAPWTAPCHLAPCHPIDAGRAGGDGGNRNEAVS
ncbi:MAG: 3-keto-5-aminohexanoate cleavage protein [Janthinobacterium lividum]